MVDVSSGMERDACYGPLRDDSYEMAYSGTKRYFSPTLVSL